MLPNMFFYSIFKIIFHWKYASDWITQLLVRPVQIAQIMAWERKPNNIEILIEYGIFASINAHEIVVELYRCVECVSSTIECPERSNK